jgi:pSer/pThr/pTyr-binding forkhead associated (FHA) protein
MEQTVTLTFMSGSRDGEVVQLQSTGAVVSIGRTAPCELVLPDDPDISRRHARLVWSGSAWTLEDAGSSNGTFLGEFQSERKLATPNAIKDGEIFRVGLTRLRLGGVKNKQVAGVAAAAKR